MQIDRTVELLVGWGWDQRIGGARPAKAKCQQAERGEGDQRAVVEG